MSSATPALLNKPIYKSITAWGVVIFVAAEAGITQACGGELLGAGLCGTIAAGLKYVGGALTALGLRRAAVAPNVT